MPARLVYVLSQAWRATRGKAGNRMAAGMQKKKKSMTNGSKN